MIIRCHEPRPRLDARPLAKRVGLLILATDHTTEPDYRRMVASDEVGVYVARIPYANPTTPENLREMQPRLAEGASLILPGESLDAICYSCTSASVAIGDDEVESAVSAGKPDVPVVTPVSAGARALRTLRARRISLLTPYTVETTRPMVDWFALRGFEIASVACLGFDDDREMARIAPQEIVALAKQTIVPDAEALFLSCTALRAAGVIAEIEREIDRPAVSSNLASAWMCLRFIGDRVARPQWGRLMAETEVAA